MVGSVHLLRGRFVRFLDHPGRTQGTETIRSNLPVYGFWCYASRNNELPGDLLYQRPATLYQYTRLSLDNSDRIAEQTLSELNESCENVSEIDQSGVEDFPLQESCNVPAASHMGGVWERQVRTIRRGLWTTETAWIAA